MKKESVLTKNYIEPENASAVFEARTAVRPMKQRGISDEKLATLLAEIQQKLTEGLSSAAEKIITTTLANFSHAPESRAKLINCFPTLLKRKVVIRNRLKLSKNTMTRNS